MAPSVVRVVWMAPHNKQTAALIYTANMYSTVLLCVCVRVCVCVCVLLCLCVLLYTMYMYAFLANRNYLQYVVFEESAQPCEK